MVKAQMDQPKRVKVLTSSKEELGQGFEEFQAAACATDGPARLATLTSFIITIITKAG